MTAASCALCALLAGWKAEVREMGAPSSNYLHSSLKVTLHEMDLLALNCCCRCLGRSCSKACGPPGSPRIVCSVSGIRHALADDACRLIGGHLLELRWWQSPSLICSHDPFPLKATCCREDTGQGHCRVAKNLEWLASQTIAQQPASSVST